MKQASNKIQSSPFFRQLKIAAVLLLIAPAMTFAGDRKVSCDNYKLTQGALNLFCVDDHYKFNTNGAEKFKTLMRNGQYSLSKEYQNGKCIVDVSVSGQVYGSSYSDRIICDLTPYVK